MKKEKRKKKKEERKKNFNFRLDNYEYVLNCKDLKSFKIWPQSP